MKEILTTQRGNIEATENNKNQVGLTQVNKNNVPIVTVIIRKRKETKKIK